MNPVHPESAAAAAAPSIVVHTSERPEGAAALRWALQHVEERTAQYPENTTVHVVLSHSDREGGRTFFSPAVLEDLQAQLTGSGLPHQVHGPTDDPAGQVIDLAENVQAQLVVTGVARRSATMKLILGSHTQRILLGADCPVVAVKH
ncbi:nucleotide-binding universal stress UspA family protein [Kineococcus radiotolerans]|uniref:Nucleotide-binding universal stress UspA family protein n=1 Tax=Kineococcus radiotolerans TaxID=131568 RepID=A0A7W4XZA1_KINRA|nr:universal stress protein [Kineococcus radiotolerans]MBB2903135.1 nucleotide-binding universal stress UspA family protein [Kineococcus radiotolerans]